MLGALLDVIILKIQSGPKKIGLGRGETKG